MPHKRALLLVALFAAACTHVSRSTVLMSTNVAGSQIVTTRGNEVTIDYEYTDRGRGPKTHTAITLDERGVPVALLTTGSDYLKQPVEERYRASGAGFYTSTYGPPEELAILARALLRNGGRMALLPGGEASIRKAGEATVRGTHVTAYEIAGLGFTPFELWLDDDLQFFGSLSSYQSIVRAGFESGIKPLLDAQDARAATRLGELAKRLTHAPAMGRLTIMNARIFDPRSGTISEPVSIHVEGNRIARIGGLEERNAADVWDAGGRIVLPGLWDMHTHSSDVDGLLQLAAGVTSIRDLGNDNDFIISFRRQIDAGEVIGPRIVLAGIIDGPGPFQAPTNVLVSTGDEARKAVDFYAEHGYEGIKIYSSVKPELVPLLAQRAHEHGLRVSGHIPAGMRAENAVDAGYDEFQHLNMFFLNFMPDVTETRTPARFTVVAKRGADLDLQSSEVQAFIGKLRTRGTVVDLTLSVFENMFLARKGTVSPAYAAVADRFPPQVRRAFFTGGLPVPDGLDERYRASFRKMLDAVAELHRSGVTIVAGTDGLAGFTLHRELELYAQAGIPNADVLRIATLVPAQILKREKDLGTIEEGKLADFIVVDGDPLANISDIRRVVRVVKNGAVFVPAELYREVGVTRNTER